MERPPHYARVRALLDALDAPVVQLWGWAGTGKRAILQALLEDQPGAEYLPAAWLAAPDKLEQRLRRRIGRRPALLVCEGDRVPHGLAPVASWLRPGQRLLVAGERRIEVPGGSIATPPESLLLRADEIRKLWRGAAGRLLTGADAERLLERSDGWLYPLSMWARDPSTASGRFGGDDRALWEPLADFLRERVLTTLTADEEALLLELAARVPVPWETFLSGEDSARRETTLRGMLERMALPRRCAQGRLLLPAPLTAFLAVEATLRRAGLPARVGEERSAASTLDGAAAPRGDPRGNRVAVASGLTARGSLPGAAEIEERDRHPAAADVRITLLGMPRVERCDSSGRMTPVAWSFKRPLRILAYLASAPDLQASREEIVSILWPDASEDVIRRNLHPAVSWLRRSVWPGSAHGAVVLLRDGVYSLDPALRWEVDVRSFLERVEEGAGHLARNRAEEAERSWEAAWRLYHGAFLQGWSDRWILAQRDELQLRFTDLLRRLGDLKARLGRLTEAEDAYRTLLLEDPLEEGVHVSIMRIYAARGRRDLVNRQYQRLRHVLLHELGVEPSPPTLDAFNDLML
ncbi:MAG TPA: BTAD domain-containing putative transcriptional regulator [Thermoanaerobaculia bacterium]|nr:BTAD domain-containing putative transcriptional regulator [Thermoanaerobaculia bacterium]